MGHHALAKESGCCCDNASDRIRERGVFPVMGFTDCDAQLWRLRKYPDNTRAYSVVADRVGPRG